MQDDNSTGTEQTSRADRKRRRPILVIVAGVVIVAILAVGVVVVPNSAVSRKILPSWMVGGLTSSQQAALDTAISDIGKIDAAIQVGVNYQQYGMLLINAKASVNEAERVIKDKSIRDLLDQTMDCYVDAAKIWSFKISSPSLVVIKPEYSESAIATKYDVTPVYINDYIGSGVRPDVLQQKIWTVASIKYAALKALRSK